MYFPPCASTAFSACISPVLLSLSLSANIVIFAFEFAFTNSPTTLIIFPAENVTTTLKLVNTWLNANASATPSTIA